MQELSFNEDYKNNKFNIEILNKKILLYLE